MTNGPEIIPVHSLGSDADLCYNESIWIWGVGELVMDGQSGLGLVFLTVAWFQALAYVMALLPLPQSICRKPTDSFRIFRWRNLVVSCCHAVITGAWCFACVFWYGDAMWLDLMGFKNWLSYGVACFSTGYFAYDSLDIILFGRVREKWEVLIHHLAILASAVYAITTVQFVGYHVVAMIIEINTAFLHARKMMLMSGYSRSYPPLRVVMGLNVISFCLFRLVPLYLETMAVFYNWWKVPVWFFVNFTACLIVLIGMNVVLLNRLIRIDFYRPAPSMRTLDAIVSEDKLDAVLAPITTDAPSLLLSSCRKISILNNDAVGLDLDEPVEGICERLEFRDRVGLDAEDETSCPPAMAMTAAVEKTAGKLGDLINRGTSYKFENTSSSVCHKKDELVAGVSQLATGVGGINDCDCVGSSPNRELPSADGLRARKLLSRDQNKVVCCENVNQIKSNIAENNTRNIASIREKKCGPANNSCIDSIISPAADMSGSVGNTIYSNNSPAAGIYKPGNALIEENNNTSVKYSSPGTRGSSCGCDAVECAGEAVRESPTIGSPSVDFGTASEIPTNATPMFSTKAVINNCPFPSRLIPSRERAAPDAKLLDNHQAFNDPDKSVFSSDNDAANGMLLSNGAVLPAKDNIISSDQ